ncbi:MAG: 1-phosphofructokinase [Chloroflexi bacterium]|nr:MAG: 1-phosphofructokinase [Chloroflexota bacterium]MBL1192969.1 1-phosphofructokinase [Chloroflexota bacterium]NOH10261.1 1-phosphofructokinase [Chloroflexota bacterium]
MIYTVTLNPAVDYQYVVPEMEFNQVLRAVDTHIDMGGKGFNVSRMLAELQVASSALGFIGGNNGAVLKEGLETLGIDTKLISIPGETRLNVSIVTETHDTYIKVNEPGPDVPPEKVAELLALIQKLAAPGDWWILSGSVPPDVDTAIYAKIIKLVRSVGADTVLDTSGEPLRLGIDARPTVVKPNAEEAIQLTGSSLANQKEIVLAARDIGALGADNVVISLGKEGALLDDGETAWLLSTPTIKEKNPIGAGDSLVAGLVSKLHQNDSFPNALKWGIACGAATAGESGTAVGSRADVEALVLQITSKEVSNAIHG